MARALYDHEYGMGRTWEEAPDWMQAAYTERAVALRGALLGGENR